MKVKGIPVPTGGYAAPSPVTTLCRAWAINLTLAFQAITIPRADARRRLVDSSRCQLVKSAIGRLGDWATGQSGNVMG
jgi:hypothetical protein